MKRRLIVLLASLAMVLTFAPTVSATSNGSCVTPNGSHFLAGEQSNQTARRIKANVNVNDTNAILCNRSLTDTPDDGVFHGISLAGGHGYGGHAQLFIGISNCRNPVTPSCSPDIRSNHLFINNVMCDFPSSDLQIDLGPADESGEDLEISWDATNKEWDFYKDGGAYTGYSFSTLSPHWSCMNPEKGSGYEVYGLWQSERLDLGDGWGEVTHTKFTNMYYAAAASSGWITAGDYASCDFNTHDYTPHRQFCDMPALSSTSMDTWTSY